MNAKQIKYLSLIEGMAKADMRKEETAKKYFPSLLNLDYALALDTWEYICTQYETQIAASEELSRTFGGAVFELFAKKGITKTMKAINEIPALRRTVYQYAPVAYDSAAFGALADMLAANKTDPADEIFKCVVKNERIQYGPFMKTLLERVFIEIMKKNPAKKMEMPRKLAALLLSYVGKIKTDERSMLQQRIRETQ